MFTFVPYWGFILISSFPSICLPVGLCVSRLYCAVVWASVSVVHIVLSCGPLSSPSVLCTLRANNLSVAVLKGTLSACLYTPDSSIFSCSETWVQRYGVTYTIRLITKACTRQIRLAFFFILDRRFTILEMRHMDCWVLFSSTLIALPLWPFVWIRNPRVLILSTTGIGLPSAYSVIFGLSTDNLRLLRVGLCSNNSDFCSEQHSPLSTIYAPTVLTAA